MITAERMTTLTDEEKKIRRKAAARKGAETRKAHGLPIGFQMVPKDRLLEIATKGGKAAHVAGTAHEFTTEEARAAGRKGGKASHAKRKAGAK